MMTVMKRIKNENRLSIEDTSREFVNTDRGVSASEADTRNVASNRTGKKKRATGMTMRVAPCESKVERGMALSGFTMAGKLGDLGRWRRTSWSKRAVWSTENETFPGKGTDGSVMTNAGNTSIAGKVCIDHRRARDAADMKVRITSRVPCSFCPRVMWKCGGYNK
jgi:hypothetical protein